MQSQQRLTIRAASAGDAGAVARLRAAVLAEGRWFLADPDEVRLDDDAVAAELRRLDQERNSRVLLGWRGATLVGACWLRGGWLRRTAHEAALELMVSESDRGRGTGRRLLAEALAWAEGAPELQRVALSVLADNDRARHLYEAAGFALEGRRRGAIREPDGRLRDDLLMARDVPTPQPALAEGLLDFG